MEASQNPHSKDQARKAQAVPAKTYRPVEQPLDVIAVPGAMLRIETLAMLVGQSTQTLYRAARRGELVLTKRGAHFTRVKSEDARAYMARLGGEAA